MKSPAEVPESGPAAPAGTTVPQSLSSVQLWKSVRKQRGRDMERQRRKRDNGLHVGPRPTIHSPGPLCQSPTSPVCPAPSPALSGRPRGPASPVRVVGAAGHQSPVLPSAGGPEARCTPPSGLNLTYLAPRAVGIGLAGQTPRSPGARAHRYYVPETTTGRDF